MVRLWKLTCNLINSVRLTLKINANFSKFQEVLISYNKVHLNFFKTHPQYKISRWLAESSSSSYISGKIEEESAGRVQLVNQPKHLQGSLQDLHLPYQLRGYLHDTGMNSDRHEGVLAAIHFFLCIYMRPV